MKEFRQSPLDDREREKLITNMKNIAFLFLDQKLIQKGMRLKDVVPQFDKENKGYLSYDEFRTVLKSLDFAVTENQITEVIKGVDVDGDGNIQTSELVEVSSCVSRGAPNFSFRRWSQSKKWAWSPHLGSFMLILHRHYIIFILPTPPHPRYIQSLQSHS